MIDLSTYTYLGKTYNIKITRKRMRTIRYRLINDTFLISAPYLCSKGSIKRGLDKFAEKLIKGQKPASEGKDFIYIFGYKHRFADSGEIKFTNGQIIKFSSRDEFEKKMRKFFLSVITSRVRLFEGKMGLKPHNVRVRKMTSRYGSNSKHTNTVSFALSLYHYSYEIIDSIVVHELAHSIHFDHSKAFYDVVYKYCPNYEDLHKKLTKGDYL